MRCSRNGVVTGNDRVRLSVDDLASEIAIALGPALTRIPLDGEILSLDVAQPAQLLEKRLPGANSRSADGSDGTCRDDDRNAVLLPPLLRPHRTCGGREQQTNREIASSHIITSSAAVGTPGTIASRALAFRSS
jgi:hypothetical protein